MRWIISNSMRRIREIGLGAAIDRAVILKRVNCRRHKIMFGVSVSHIEAVRVDERDVGRRKFLCSASGALIFGTAGPLQNRHIFERGVSDEHSALLFVSCHDEALLPGANNIRAMKVPSLKRRI